MRISVYGKKEINISENENKFFNLFYHINKMIKTIYSALYSFKNLFFFPQCICNGIRAKSKYIKDLPCKLMKNH